MTEAHGDEVRDALDTRRRFEIEVRCNNDFREGTQTALIYMKVFRGAVKGSPHLGDHIARRAAFDYAKKHHGDVYSCVSIISCVETI